MVISPDIRIDLSEFDSYFRQVERDKMPTILRNTVNDTARGAWTEVRGKMDQIFDRPTPYAKRGVVYDKATKENLRAVVAVTGDRTRGGLPATAFLGPQISGGIRRHKAFELQLIQRGFMTRQQTAVPARAAPLDRYGNMTQGFLNKVMSDIGIEYRGEGATRIRQPGGRRPRRAKAARFFVKTRETGSFPGVYERELETGSIRPVILFTNAEPYAVRFHFNDIVEAHVNEHIRENFAVAFAQTMRLNR